MNFKHITIGKGFKHIHLMTYTSANEAWMNIRYQDSFVGTKKLSSLKTQSELSKNLSS